ncbi:hypothetical protein INR49_022346 [Caranx melampygus]|nr:hypothetical protein INR49_022346 [Caranx melampygus]
MSENSSVYDELRLACQLCDAVIRVYNTEFHVHKLVLCNCSPYFRTLFTLWSNPDDRDFDLSCVPPDMMRLIIDFAYTGIVPVTPENVRELFIAADRFDILGIVEACGHLLEEQLTPELHQHLLKHKAFLYILNHFEEIDTTSVEFLQLSEMEITKIIENDQLNVRKEEMVFEAILQWINYTPEQRRAYISQLLPKVKLA